MNIIQAILMGIVQGLSEFLPISSSAHLVFASNFYKVLEGIDIVQNTNEEVFFDIMVHLGTLVSVLIFFRKDILNILKAFIKGLKTGKWDDIEAKLGLYIIIGTFLTVVMAYPLNNIAERLVYSPSIVGLLLIFTGFLLIYCEIKSKQVKNYSPNINLKQSIFIGLAQGLAALPGFSRSGWTIATGLFLGLDRTLAARYSFLLSVPIIFGASMFYPVIEIDFSETINYNWTAIMIGTVVSGIVGYLCIKYFMKFISRFSLKLFGYYCIFAGFFAFVFFKFYG